MGERLLKDSAMLVRNEMKKEEKNISRLCACKWCCREWCWQVWWLREGGGSMVACVPTDRVVIIPLASCYTPIGRIMRCVDSGCKVGSGLQFGDSQVLTEQGSKSM